MKHLFPLCISFLLYLPLFAQSGLLAIEEDGKWGLINTAGKIIVEPAYDLAIGGRHYGILRNTNPNNNPSKTATVAIVNLKGEFILPNGPHQVRGLGGYHPANRGMQIVHVSGKEGVMDSLGNFLIAPKFHWIGYFDRFRVATVEEDGKYGVMDLNGKVWIEPQYPDKESAHAAYEKQKMGPAFAGFDKTQPLSDGRVAVYKGKIGRYGDTEENNWGFADANGNVVIPGIYKRVNSFADGIARVEVDGKAGFLDREGNEVIPVKYEMLTEMRNDRIWAIVGRDTEKPTSIIFDGKGNQLNRYDGELLILNSRYFYAEQWTLLALSLDGAGQFYGSKGVGIIRASDGKEILPPVYNYVRYAGEGLTKFAKDCQCATESATFGLCTVEEMGYTATATGCKFGVVDYKGKIIFQPEFTNIGKFYRGQAYALKGKELYLLTAKGKQTATGLILPDEYCDATHFYMAFEGGHPGMPMILNRRVVLEGRNITQEIVPESTHRGAFSLFLRPELGHIYKVTASKDSWGYVRFPSGKLVHWCGEVPAALK